MSEVNFNKRNFWNFYIYIAKSMIQTFHQDFNNLLSKFFNILLKVKLFKTWI